MSASPETMALSPTIAHVLLTRSPWHAFQRHRLGGGVESEPTDATRRGNLIETLLLGGGKDIVVVGAKDWRTNAAKDARAEAEAAGKIAVLTEKFEDAVAAVKVLREAMPARVLNIAGDAKKQHTLEWISDGVLCKGKLDLFHRDALSIMDLKTCENASGDVVARSIVAYGADIQHAAYIEGAAANHAGTDGRWEFSFVHVEPDFGVVAVRGLSGALAELGARKWARAKRIWKRCLETDTWPAYEAKPIEALPWALAQELDQQIAEGEQP